MMETHPCRCFPTVAFPMVLAGTALTACVAYFLFPYGWSFSLAMTFGAILSATVSSSCIHLLIPCFLIFTHSFTLSLIKDPAAVAALMSSLGAPPRLQMHIGGESMLNDGSSFVFYTIFSSLFLFELGIPGVGATVNLGQGVATFFREAFGAAAFGIAFGLGLTFFLYKLNRRLNDQENVVQIVATITVAYLSYYTADVSGCSGVISVVSCGITAKAYGNAMINDQRMMDSFWSLVEQLLNTVRKLFLASCNGDINGPHCLLVGSSLSCSSRSQAVSVLPVDSTLSLSAMITSMFLTVSLSFISCLGCNPREHHRCWRL